MKVGQTCLVPVLMVGLSVLALPAVAHAGDSDGTWVDASTGLTWARQDNGTDVHWRQASSYCSALKLGGHSDRRLPIIEEITGVYDSGEVSKCGQSDCHVKAAITLSSDVAWSSLKFNPCLSSDNRD